MDKLVFPGFKLSNLSCRTRDIEIKETIQNIFHTNNLEDPLVVKTYSSNSKDGSWICNKVAFVYGVKLPWGGVKERLKRIIIGGRDIELKTFDYGLPRDVNGNFTSQNKLQNESLKQNDGIMTVKVNIFNREMYKSIHGVASFSILFSGKLTVDQINILTSIPGYYTHRNITYSEKNHFIYKCKTKITFYTKLDTIQAICILSGNSDFMKGGHFMVSKKHEGRKQIMRINDQHKFLPKALGNNGQTISVRDMQLKHGHVPLTEFSRSILHPYKFKLIGSTCTNCLSVFKVIGIDANLNWMAATCLCIKTKYSWPGEDPFVRLATTKLMEKETIYHQFKFLYQGPQPFVLVHVVNKISTSIPALSNLARSLADTKLPKIAKQNAVVYSHCLVDRSDDLNYGKYHMSVIVHKEHLWSREDLIECSGINIIKQDSPEKHVISRTLKLDVESKVEYVSHLGEITYKNPLVLTGRLSRVLDIRENVTRIYIIVYAPLDIAIFDDEIISLALVPDHQNYYSIINAIQYLNAYDDQKLNMANCTFKGEILNALIIPCDTDSIYSVTHGKNYTATWHLDIRTQYNSVWHNLLLFAVRVTTYDNTLLLKYNDQEITEDFSLSPLLDLAIDLTLPITTSIGTLQGLIRIKIHNIRNTQSNGFLVLSGKCEAPYPWTILNSTPCSLLPMTFTNGIEISNKESYIENVLPVPSFRSITRVEQTLGPQPIIIHEYIPMMPSLHFVHSLLKGHYKVNSSEMQISAREKLSICSNSILESIQQLSDVDEWLVVKKMTESRLSITNVVKGSYLMELGALYLHCIEGSCSDELVLICCNSDEETKDIFSRLSDIKYKIGAKTKILKMYSKGSENDMKAFGRSPKEEEEYSLHRLVQSKADLSTDRVMNLFESEKKFGKDLMKDKDVRDLDTYVHNFEFEAFKDTGIVVSSLVTALDGRITKYLHETNCHLKCLILHNAAKMSLLQTLPLLLLSASRTWLIGNDSVEQVTSAANIHRDRETFQIDGDISLYSLCCRL